MNSDLFEYISGRVLDSITDEVRMSCVYNSALRSIRALVSEEVSESVSSAGSSIWISTENKLKGTYL
jgi:ADP-dependent phosphofructokinase/glucokinase